MKRMKIFVLVLAFSLVFVGCSQKNEKEVEKEEIAKEEAIEEINEEEYGEFHLSMGEKARLTYGDVTNMFGDDQNILEFYNEFAGREAKDFGLIGLDGENKKLSDFYGENVIVEFMGSWCPACREGLFDGNKFNEEYNNATLIGVGINETKEGLSSLKSEAENIDFYFLETEKETVDDYNVFFVPLYFFIDSEGIVQAILPGSTPLFMLKEMSDIVFE